MQVIIIIILHILMKNNILSHGRTQDDAERSHPLLNLPNQITKAMYQIGIIAPILSRMYFHLKAGIQNLTYLIIMKSKLIFVRYNFI